MDLKNYISIVPDWPKPGVNFLDMGGVLANPEAFQFCVNQIANRIRSCKATSVVAVESRGFVFASAACAVAGAPLYLARKSGKLPGHCRSINYTTEYSTDTIEIQSDSNVGSIPLIVDDVIATGGTISAVGSLLKQHWPVEQIYAAAVIALDFLPGVSRLNNHGIITHALIHYA